MAEKYLAVYEGAQAEIIEKKSRFIATVRKTETEEEAVAFIQEMKKKYWDARHNCSAFTIGRNHELTRCSDDGEPSSTAGRPMLDVLLKEDIHNVTVVVTRYFGGVLLGTGGLVRAYQKTVQEGLKNARMIEICPGYRVEIETDYNGIGKLQYIIGKEQLPIVDTVYAENVRMTVMIPAEEKDHFTAEVIDGTNAAAKLSVGDLEEYGRVDGEVVFF
jgi:uncharacterized YigZ family protein